MYLKSCPKRNHRKCKDNNSTIQLEHPMLMYEKMKEDRRTKALKRSHDTPPCKGKSCGTGHDDGEGV